jgi:hypothetical protein
MKRLGSIFLSLGLTVSCLSSQEREDGQFFDVPVISHSLTRIPSEVPVINLPLNKAPMVQSMVDGEVKWVPASNPCDDRERRIRKMMIDIECDGISLEELGFECDTNSCEVGIDAKFVVYWQSNKRWGNGEYLTLVRPASKKTAQNWLRGDEGQRTSPYFPIGTPCTYAIGDTLEMK